MLHHSHSLLSRLLFRRYGRNGRLPNAFRLLSSFRTMTPLTHAALGAAIFKSTQRAKWRYGSWLLALVLAFASHFLLDAIPHFDQKVFMSERGEEMYPLDAFGYKVNLPVMKMLGIGGLLLALLLMRLNPDVGKVFLVIALWIGIGGYRLTWVKILTGALALGYVAWKSANKSSVGYLLGGMMAVLPDLIPRSFTRLTAFHNYAHSRVNWASHFYFKYTQYRDLNDWHDALYSHYDLLAYGPFVLLEGMIFLGALYLLTREKFVRKNRATSRVDVMESLELPEET